MHRILLMAAGLAAALFLGAGATPDVVCDDKGCISLKKFNAKHRRRA